MRNYLSSLGFKYEKIKIREDISTFRFEVTPELQEALTNYTLKKKGMDKTYEQNTNN
jgi:hypothetical protein